MNQTAFERWLGEFKSDLEFAKTHYKARVRAILKRNAKSLAQLSEGQIRTVIEFVSSEHFCEEKDLRRTVSYGKGEMPEHIYDQWTITEKTWREFPESARKTLSNVTNTIMMKKGNSVVQVPVAAIPKLKEPQIRKIFSANHPEWGLLNPDDKPDRTVRPKYYTMIEATPDGAEEIVLVSRMMGTMTLCKTRMRIDELRSCLEAVSTGRTWRRR